VAVTVSQLCELPIFKDGFELIAGREGLNRGVQHVTILEVPDFAEFDLGNELFVLTTFYPFSNNIALAADVVAQLCEKKVTALAVKIDRFVDDIPSSIIKIANDNKMPLFKIKKNIAFREIISAISSEIIDSQLKTISGLNKQHESLIASILRGDKIETFINTLGVNLHCYCACISASRTILAQYFTAEAQGKEDNIESLIDEIVHLRGNSLTYNCIGGYCVFPCSVYNQAMGYLVVKLATPINDHELLFVKQMVSFLSVKILEQHLKIETEQRMITAIADEILFHCHSDESVVQERTKLLGLVPKKHHFIVLLSFRQENFKDILQITFYNWTLKLNNLFLNSAVFLKGSEIVTIVSVADKSPYMHGTAIKHALIGLIEKNTFKEDKEVDFGYSLIVQDFRLLPDCYEQAKKALKFGKLFNPQANVFPYSEFIEQGLISHSLGTYEHQIVVEKILAPINEYDRKYNSTLWMTLEKCLLTSSLEQASKELHIHSSTLRYRLQKIKSITDVDFFLPQGKFFLTFAYVLSKIGENLI
jgi:purine catabolism regulator